MRSYVKLDFALNTLPDLFGGDGGQIGISKDVVNETDVLCANLVRD
jgi:hypothetical protein